MSNVTVTRLGDAAQANDPDHRLDYIRQDQKAPVYKNRTSGSDIHSYGMVGLLFFGLLAAVLWVLKLATCWGVSAYSPTASCTVLSVAALSWTVGVPLLVLLSWCVLLYGKLQKDRSEALSNRIVRDRYSNPVDALTVVSPDWNAAAYFASAQQAEITMAPFKQLPAGLDSLSMSSPASGKAAAAAAEDGSAAAGITPIPIATWFGWLDQRPHLLVAGSTDAGKTTTIKALLAPRIQAGEQLCIIDPHSSHWFGIVGIGGGEDWQAVRMTLTQVQAEYYRRLQVRKAHLETTGEELPVTAFERLTVLLDEANNAQAALDVAPRGKESPWQMFVKALGSGARKVRMSIILSCQSTNVDDLNISGGMRHNFAGIALDDRAIKLMIMQDEKDPARRAALYQALEGRAYPATMTHGSQVYLLDRTGLADLPMPSTDTARACVWQPPQCIPVPTHVPSGTDERDALARALFARGAKFRPVAEVLRKRGYSIDNNRLSELYREVNGAP